MTDYMKDISSLSCGNIGALSILCEIKRDELDMVLSQLKKYNITGRHIWCLFKDRCDKDYDQFVSVILNMKERPTSCHNGLCNWDIIDKYEDKDEDKDGDNYGCESVNKCISIGCGKICNTRCGACYSVNYCSLSCQKRDRPNHKKECDSLIKSIKMCAPYGKQYSKIIIMKIIKINDVCFDKLWNKHAASIKQLDFIRVKK